MNTIDLCAMLPLFFLAISLFLHGIAGELVSTHAGSFTQALSVKSIPNGCGLAMEITGNYFVADLTLGVIVLISDNDGSITTYAGGGASTADGAVGTNIFMNQPWGLSSDTLGNVYYSENSGCRVRGLSPAKVVTTLVGVHGTCAFNGNQVGISTHLKNPRGIFFDPVGRKLYIVDSGNQLVRALDMVTKVVTTVAGNTTAGFADNIAATASMVNGVYDIWVNTLQDVYFTDNTNCRVRRVVQSTGQIETIAGISGSCAFNSGSVATSVSISNPNAICGDLDGNVYFAQYTTFTYFIRKVTPLGAISFIAGINANNGPTYAGIAATSISIGNMFGCKIDTAANLVLFDNTLRVLWKVPAPVSGSSVISAVIGYTNDQTVASTSMTFSKIYSLWGDTNGKLYICDYGFHRVLVEVGGQITALAGTGLPGQGLESAAATTSRLTSPYAVAGDSAGNMYITNSGYHQIRKVAVSTNLITTISGRVTPSSGCGAAYTTYSGPAAATDLCIPHALTVDSSAGVLYFADDNKSVRKIVLSTGILSLVANSGTTGYLVGGVTVYIKALWTDNMGLLYGADFTNNRVHAIDLATTTVSLYAGTGDMAFNGDNIPATQANVYHPFSVCGNSGGGGVFIASLDTYRIRYVRNTNMMITTVSGSGSNGIGGEAVFATSAAMGVPYGCFVDTSGKLYYSEAYTSLDSRIRVTIAQYPTSQPSTQPSRQPSRQPQGAPSSQPSRQPSRQPSAQPSRQPSRQPTGQPTDQPTSDRIPSCPGIFTWLSGCYYKIGSSATWTVQSGQCANAGGWLATVRSAEENANIYSWLVTGDTWIGLNDVTTEGTFVWANGDTATYRNWFTGYPTTGPTNDCVVISTSTAGQWGDTSCTNTRQAICQASPTCPGGFHYEAADQVCRANQPSSQPSVQPSVQPIAQPTGQPSRQPSMQPSRQPIAQPTSQPSKQPTGKPSDSDSARIPNCPDGYLLLFPMCYRIFTSYAVQLELPEFRWMVGHDPLSCRKFQCAELDKCFYLDWIE